MRGVLVEPWQVEVWISEDVCAWAAVQVVRGD